MDWTPYSHTNLDCLFWNEGGEGYALSVERSASTTAAVDNFDHNMSFTTAKGFRLNGHNTDQHGFILVVRV